MLRTVQYGDLWCDLTASRTLGMPPAALSRSNPMSDKLNSLICNPYFYVREVATCLMVLNFAHVFSYCQLNLIDTCWYIFNLYELWIILIRFQSHHAPPCHAISQNWVELVLSEEGQLADMSVHWALKGALVHNVCMAMCVAPCINREWSLSDRCQTAAAGFVSIDLFRMLGKMRASDLGVPTGSQYMAPQTCHNVQGGALTVLALACSKPTSFNPFQFGFARLSEISIEQQFGFIRGQSQNSQVSARSFFQADARLTLKASEELNKKQKGPAKQEPALTQEECLDHTYWYAEL